MCSRKLSEEEVDNAGLLPFEKLAKEVQSRSEKEQYDICLMIHGYLAGIASREPAKVS